MAPKSKKKGGTPAKTKETSAEDKAEEDEERAKETEEAAQKTPEPEEEAPKDKDKKKKAPKAKAKTSLKRPVAAPQKLKGSKGKEKVKNKGKGEVKDTGKALIFFVKSCRLSKHILLFFRLWNLQKAFVGLLWCFPQCQAKTIQRKMQSKRKAL